jgi:antitoxin component of MazEF toxin-antitoxin module
MKQKEIISSKVTKRWGTSLLITLSFEEKRALNLELNDILNVKLFKEKQNNNKWIESSKFVKRWGTSLVLLLSFEEKDLLNLKEGDMLKVKLSKTGEKAFEDNTDRGRPKIKK